MAPEPANSHLANGVGADRPSPEIASEWVTAGGFSTHYLSAGPVSAAPVVLLHDGAWGGDANLSWAPVMRNLAEKYRVFAPDMLGFGRTDKAVYLDRDPYGFRIKHLGAFLRAVGVSRAVHLVGTSFGGSIALRASYSAKWPIASVISVGGTGGPWRLEAGKSLLGSIAPGLGYVARVVEALANTTEGLDDHIEQRYRNALQPGHYAALMAPRLRHPDDDTGRGRDEYPDALGQARCQVTVVTMTDDRLIEPGWQANVQRVAPLVMFREIDGPHSPNIVRPVEVASLLNGLFEDLEHEGNGPNQG